MQHFYRNVTFSGIDLDQYFVKRPQAIRECLAEIVQPTSCGVIGPIESITEVPISQALTGFRKLQSGTNTGAIVLTMGPEEKVVCECASRLNAHPSKQLLRHDATYLVTWGTGGIGRSLVPFLLESGASNIVLLGRSANSSPEVDALREQYCGNPGFAVRAIA